MSQTQNSGQNPVISEGHCDVSENILKNSTQQSFLWVVSQLVKKFPTSCLTRKFIPVFTKPSLNQPSHLINISHVSPRYSKWFLFFRFFPPKCCTRVSWLCVLHAPPILSSCTWSDKLILNKLLTEVKVAIIAPWTTWFPRRGNWIA